jgi:predicted ATPase
LALGDTPNIAARLQGLAEPDTVVVSDATYRLVQGYFTGHNLGPQILKGMETPVPAYRVLEASGAQSRLEVVSPSGLTPLVGREAEVTLLCERWAQVQDGLGQAVVLSGEAGIGKSRLVMALKEHVAGAPHTRLECRCSPYYQGSALYPIVELSQRVLQFGRDEAPAAKFQKIKAGLERYDLAQPDTVALWTALLSVPHVDCYPPLNLTPQRQKQKTLAAIVALLLAQAAEQPVLFIVEDVHWVDPSTLEFLTLLIDQGPAVRILTLLTCRPEFHAPWDFRTHLIPLTLTRLPRPQVPQMIVRVTGDKALPPEVVEQIVAKTDGVPLFVEELTKMVLESGLLREGEERYELTGPLPPLAIPATLHDSLMARLDRLATVKDVAQLGATIGRTFTYELLQAVSPLDAAVLQQGLRQLVEAELVYQRGLPPQATYTFKHALIQDAAYQSLLRSTRQQYHQRIAQVLEAQFPEMAETQPELLAQHYTAADCTEQAVVYWQQAGQRALERSAYQEAIQHLTHGLTLLSTLPETPARAQQELNLQIALGPALMNTKGQAAPEVERAYARTRELCQQVGDTPQLFPVLWGLWSFHHTGGKLQTARELGEHLLSLSHRIQDSSLRLEAHRALGGTLVYLGEFAAAMEH